MATLAQQLRTHAYILVFLCVIVSQVSAQTVRISDGRGEIKGHGLMLAHLANCYVVLPKHVGGPEYSRLEVSTAEPTLRGTAIVQTPFWAGMDLAIAVVRGEIKSRCHAAIDLLKRGEDRLAANAEGDLVRITNDAGHLERVRMRIVETRYQEFDAVVTEQGKEIYQGTSGSFLFFGDIPVGMATHIPDDTQRATFLRVEEIAMNVSRWLSSGQGPSTGSAASPKPVRQPAGLEVRLVDVLPPGRTADEAAENILSPAGAYVAHFDPNDPTVLLFEVTSTTDTSLSRVRMWSEPTDDTAAPRRLMIDVDSSGGETRRWRSFWLGDMAPDGVLDTGPRVPTYARFIRLRILSAWSKGPIRLDQITFE